MDEVLIIVCAIIFILIWFIVSKKFAETVPELQGLFNGTSSVQ